MILFCWSVSSAFAGNVRGVTDTEITLGVLVDFSGPGKFAGKPLVLGFKTYVQHINDQGGIHGRKIKLIVVDNGLMPNPTLAAAKKAIFKDEIFAIPFNLGSASSSAIIPLCEEEKVVLMPHGALKRFYKPGNKWVFVPYVTQFNMGSRAVEFIIREKNPKARIGMIYQDDAFGRDGLAGARAAAKHLNTKLVAVAPYKMGTVDLSAQMRKMKEAKVDWILAWTLIQQSGFIMKAKAQMKWDVNVLGDNTTAYRLLFHFLGDLADGYMAVTPYVPWESVPERTRDILRKYGVYDIVAKYPFPAVLSLSGWTYIAAAIEGLRLAGRDLTPESYIRGLEKVRDFDAGGINPKITFRSDRHVGYFSSLIIRADAKKKKFEIISPIKEPITPQN